VTGRRRLGSGKQNKTMQSLKRESQGGQNPKFLPLKRLVQSPKYLIFSTRVREKMMGRRRNRQ